MLTDLEIARIPSLVKFPIRISDIVEAPMWEYWIWWEVRGKPVAHQTKFDYIYDRMGVQQHLNFAEQIVPLIENLVRDSWKEV